MRACLPSDHLQASNVPIGRRIRQGADALPPGRGLRLVPFVGLLWTPRNGVSQHANHFAGCELEGHMVVRVSQ